MSYNHITTLIQKWAEYESLYPNPDLKDFGRWLSEKGGETRINPNTSRKEIHVPKKWKSQEEGLKHHHQMKDNNVQIGMLIGRLSKFGKMYAKKALYQLNLNLDEFTFLAAILHLETPMKSEVINVNLFEPTSGTEILRRLIKLGYVREYANKEDRRSKLLKLTAVGEKTIFKAFGEMKKVGILVSANLNEKQKTDTIAALDYLNDFHVNLYLNYKEESIEEMIRKFISK